MEEIWRDIEGYEGMYQVSNLGRVKSFKVKEKILKSCKNDKGYLNLGLRKDNKRKTVLTHRLVANAFLKKIEGKNEVNHINFDRTDNRLINLEFVNRSENMIHSRDRTSKAGTGKLKILETNTGHHHIAKYETYYGVTFFVRKKRYLKYFRTLEEAISYRDWFIETNYTNGKANDEIVSTQGKLRIKKHTSEPNISFFKKHYRVFFRVRNSSYERHFKTLDEAISYREWFIKTNYTNGEANDEIIVLNKLRVCKTNSGEHHISFHKGLYGVTFSVRKKPYLKYFKTLEEAISYRDWFIETNYTNGKGNDEIITNREV